MGSLIAAGQPAPEFTAAGSDGRTYVLRDMVRDSRILLIFYPGNNTPG